MVGVIRGCFHRTETVHEISVKNRRQDGFRPNRNGLVMSSLIFLQPDKHTARTPPVTDSRWQGQEKLQVVWRKQTSPWPRFKSSDRNSARFWTALAATLLLHRLPENLPREMIYPQPRAASRAACRCTPKRWRVVQPTHASLPATEVLKTL